MILAEAAQHLPFLKDYWQVFTDPAHLASEASFEFISGVLLYPIARWAWQRALKSHDETVHAEELTEVEIQKLRALVKNRRIIGEDGVWID